MDDAFDGDGLHGESALVAFAQSVGVKQIFTLDKDFHIYRFKGRQAFEVLP